ncbi:MAG: alpha-galactosidase, partial [Odoribacter sp.]|nr:alpha-galactosidase [Odoribacter sp.]
MPYSYFLAFISYTLKAQSILIRISTHETDLILKTASNGRLYQSYLGTRLLHASDAELMAGSKWEVYPGSGAEDYFEPAFAIQHNDGNLTTILKYVSHELN